MKISRMSGITETRIKAKLKAVQGISYLLDEAVREQEIYRNKLNEALEDNDENLEKFACETLEILSIYIDLLDQIECEVEEC